jgi:hypothetical protein
MKHAVVGSGPCGTLAALLLLQAGHHVELFDIDSEDSLKSEVYSRQLKSVGNSLATYDIHQILQVHQGSSPLGIYRSKASGGFSNVWGATWGAQPKLNFSNWEDHHKIVTEMLIQDGYLLADANTSCDCFRNLDGQFKELESIPRTQVAKSRLALNLSKCQCIQLGLSSCTHGGVWNANLLLQKCFAFESFTYLPGMDVLQIESIDSGLLISGESFSRTFESVILATGSIGTIEILLNSLKELDSLSLRDTQMAFLPIFRMGIRSRHTGGFAFSQYSVETHFGNDQIAAHLQLYSDPEIYRERILGKVPGFLLRFAGPLIDLMLPHLSIAIIYVDSRVSPRVQFSKSLADRMLNVQFSKPERSKEGLRRKLWEIFRKLGFIPIIPLLSWSSPGESYHLGALEGDYLDEFGAVKNLPGLYVAGAISLPQIEPGPITHSAMAQTSRLIEHLVTKI